MSLLDMVDGLTEARVTFVIVGGLAARAHGGSWITEDLDICYDPDPDNVQRLASVLAQWRAYLRGVEPGLPFTMDARTFSITPVMTLVTDRGEIDVMDVVAGVGGYTEVYAESVVVRGQRVAMRVLDLPGLLKAKRAAGRPKDLKQIPELEALLELRKRR